MSVERSSVEDLIKLHNLRERAELIEDALLMNLILSLPEKLELAPRLGPSESKSSSSA